MKSQRIFTFAIATALALAILPGLAGCGSKQQDSSTAPGASPANSAPPGGAGLSPQARAAMEAQQRSEASSRAAHTGPPPGAH